MGSSYIYLYLKQLITTYTNQYIIVYGQGETTTLHSNNCSADIYQCH